ncbi:MAG: hypothetical protein ACM3RP_10090 [Chitinophagales bacterium]
MAARPDLSGLTLPDDPTGAARLLLSALQSRFPLVAEPYAALGREVGWPEAQVREQIGAWQSSGLVRRLGAVFDSRRLGYQSALLAAKVAPSDVAGIALALSAHPGITHNYLRDDAGTGYNLWFTFTAEPGTDLRRAIGELAEAVPLPGLLILSATRLFKIRVEFQLGGEAPAAPAPTAAAAPGAEGEPGGADLTEADWRIVRAFTPDLPLAPRPFAVRGAEAGFSEQETLDLVQRLRERGIIRRFGATLKHYAVGYPANAMTVWRVAPEDEERVGMILAGSPLITHCYARNTAPGWPYNLFGMMHAPTEEACREEAARLAAAAEVSSADYRLLYTRQELKKERLWYGGDRA